MKSPKQNRRGWKTAFIAVMDHYEEARTLSLSISSQGRRYEHFGTRTLSLGHNEKGVHDVRKIKRQIVHRVRIVKPSLSDFICDIELAARDMLSDEEYALFKAMFIDQIELPYNAVAAQQRTLIMNRVGREFVARKIYPLKKYFRAKYV